MNPLQLNFRGSVPWNQTTVNEDFSREPTLAEETVTATRFLRKLVKEGEIKQEGESDWLAEHRKILTTTTETPRSARVNDPNQGSHLSGHFHSESSRHSRKNRRCLTGFTDYLQGSEVHLDKLRDIFKEVMRKIHPEWDSKSPALRTKFEEAETETESLANQSFGAQQE